MINLLTVSVVYAPISDTFFKMTATTRERCWYWSWFQSWRKSFGFGYYVAMSVNTWPYSFYAIFFNMFCTHSSVNTCSTLTSWFKQIEIALYVQTVLLSNGELGTWNDHWYTGWWQSSVVVTKLNQTESMWNKRQATYRFSIHARHQHHFRNSLESLHCASLECRYIWNTACSNRFVSVSLILRLTDLCDDYKTFWTTLYIGTRQWLPVR